MVKPFPASRREAILAFHFADRVKGELMLASRLLNAVISMEGEKREGAGRLLVEFLQGLEQEIGLAQAQISDPDMVRVRTVMSGVIGMAGSGMFADIQSHLTWMVSTMATYAQRAMEYLMQEKLL